MQRFENLCTEPAFRVRTDQLTNRLRSFSDECKPIDEWVDQTGKGILVSGSKASFLPQYHLQVCAILIHIQHYSLYQDLSLRQHR